MFEGTDNSNPVLPVFMEGNHFQLDANPLPQLQLFGDCPIGCAVEPLNHMSNEQAIGGSQLNKRRREPEPTTKQQKLHMSLNNNFCLDGVGDTGKIWNQNCVSTGLKLSYEEDERNSSITSVGEGTKVVLPSSVPLGDSFKIEMNRQKEEFDHYIKLQEANLLKGLRYLRQRQTACFLNVLEKGVAMKLQEKDHEIESMNCKNKELAQRIKQAAMEAQTWHYRAKYNENVASALKTNLQQVIAQGAAQAREGCGDSEVEDVNSNTNQSQNLDAIAEASGNHLNCRACKGSEVCVLLMPCRHLCLCKDCEKFIDVCPICQSTKTASVQVFM